MAPTGHHGYRLRLFLTEDPSDVLSMLDERVRTGPPLARRLSPGQAGCVDPEPARRKAERRYPYYVQRQGTGMASLPKPNGDGDSAVIAILAKRSNQETLTAQLSQRVSAALREVGTSTPGEHFRYFCRSADFSYDMLQSTAKLDFLTRPRVALDGEG